MTNNHQPGFLTRHRTAILILSLLLFLPPLALVFQATTGDTNFCGQWCPRMFFIWREGMTVSQYFFGWLRSLAGVALLLGILLATLFAGRYWCSHLCPLGATTELGSRLVPRFMKIPFDRIPAAPVRYGYLAVYILAPLLGLGSLCCNYCNFATVPRLYGAAFNPADMAYFLRTLGVVNLLLILVLGFMARGGRAYCNFFCPIGALDALSNRFGLRLGKRFHILEHRCTGCGECRKVCPTWAINLSAGDKRIDQLSCIPCGACQQVCPEQAVIYQRLKRLPDPAKEHSS